MACCQEAQQGPSLLASPLRRWASPRDAVVVAISPDAGERYLDTIYNDEWIMQKFGLAELSALNSQPIGKYLKSYVRTFEGEELNV